MPREGGAGYARSTRPMHDLARWSALHERAPRERTPLVWLGAPRLVRRARLFAAAHTFATAQGAWPMRLVERLPTNRSWFDAASAAFFARHDALLRGERDGETFVVRALWPEDWRLGPQAPPPLALPRASSPGLALRSLMRATPAREMRFTAGTLWRRDTHALWRGKAVLAFVVNGAQGDDDDAHAGHFSLATGRIGDDGDVASWLVASIYALDAVSEKGILAGPVPLDRYQGDLNSGQSWYRPTWALCAVLDDERAAVRVQSALGRLFRHFWRGQQRYYHPTDNCTSLAIDALAALGLDLPRAGPTSRTLAWLALPWVALRERSLAQGKLAFDYLAAERTRLLPALALEAAFDRLWGMAHGPAAPGGGALARELREDLLALAWLAWPQFPSSRAWGAAPAVSLAEYRSRIPKDRAQRQVIPLPPRALPEALRDDDLLPPLPHPSDLAARAWAAVPLAALAVALVLRRA